MGKDAIMIGLLEAVDRNYAGLKIKIKDYVRYGPAVRDYATELGYYSYPNAYNKYYAFWWRQ